MSRYFFSHLLPDTIPGQYEGAFVRCLSGLNADPNFGKWWAQCSQIKRIPYMSPQITADNNLGKHASYFVERLQMLQSTMSNAWRANPICMNLTDPTIGIMDVDNAVSYMFDPNIGILRQGDPKILLFLTPSQWENKFTGPDAEIIKERILQKAELFFTGVMPDKSIHWWYYQTGLAEFEANGVFTALGTTVTPAPVPGTTTVSSNAQLKAMCLQSAIEIAVYNQAVNNKLLEIEPIEQLADTLLNGYVLKP